MLDSAENAKARNLIQYIENQRDIYKNQVERLMKNLESSDGQSDGKGQKSFRVPFEQLSIFNLDTD